MTKRIALLAAGLALVIAPPAQAQMDSRQSSGSFAPVNPAMPNGVQYGTRGYGNYAVPYGQTYGQAFGGNRYGYNPYFNPYNGPAIGPLTPYAWGGIPQPVAIGGASFSARIGNASVNFWRAPSGYCYPWLPMGGYPAFNQIIYVGPSGNNQPEVKVPAIATMLSDSNKYLDDMKKDNKLSDGDYRSLKQRATDIQNKEKSYRNQQGGELDPALEAEIRSDIEKFGREISSHSNLR